MRIDHAHWHIHHYDSRSPMTFVAAYWWKAKPGYDQQFREAWRKGTILIQEIYGSEGSRLHRAVDGRFIGVAEWPDQATWQKAYDAKMNYGDERVRSAFVDALEEWGDEPMLLMEVTDDLLGPRPGLLPE